MTIKIDALLEKSKEIYQVPRIVQNFVTEEEIQYCMSVYNTSPIYEPSTTNRATRKDFQMYDQQSRLYKMFYPKLQSLWPDKEIIIDGGNFTCWHEPVKSHTDAYQLSHRTIDEFEINESVLGFSVLVPLATNTGEGNPKTVFFNQKLYGPATSKTEDMDNEVIPDVGIIEEFTYTDFDKSSEQYKHVNNHSDKRLYGLSIHSVLPWQYGSAIIWHRCQYHCSAVYENFNSKTHLLFLVNFKAQ